MEKALIKTKAFSILINDIFGGIFMDVIGIDNLVMDFLVQIKSLPTSNKSCPYEQASWQGGGNVASAMAASARLGASVGMIGMTGDDQYGRFNINDFKLHGIDVSHIAIDKEAPTGFCICLAETSTKMRSFIFSQSGCRSLRADEIDRDYIASARYIHVGRLDSTAIEAARIAKEFGVQVSIDAGGFDQKVEDNIKLFDIFIASEFYHDALFDNKNYKENCAKILAKGPKIAVVTLGERGCVGMQDGHYFELPAFDVPIIDTTGAGDVFHGAFIYGLTQGWDAEKSSRFSSAVSAIKCTRLGGRAAIPDGTMVDRFLKDGYIDYAKIDERVRLYENGLENLGGKI